MGENDRMTPEADTEGSRAVLIVEDSVNSAATIELALSEIPGLSVLFAASGVEALRIMDQPGSAVQAIITDLNMPRMDGFELIRRIRENGRTSAIPIIVVSADTDPETPERIAQMKVDAFFAKPFSPAQVCKKLEQLLNATMP
jgi:CheY-like chemotaxis protein